MANAPITNISFLNQSTEPSSALAKPASDGSSSPDASFDSVIRDIFQARKGRNLATGSGKNLPSSGLQTVAIGPRVKVITAEDSTLDEKSLLEFARTQGLGNGLLKMLGAKKKNTASAAAVPDDVSAALAANAASGRPTPASALSLVTNPAQPIVVSPTSVDASVGSSSAGTGGAAEKLLAELKSIALAQGANPGAAGSDDSGKAAFPGNGTATADGGPIQSGEGHTSTTILSALGAQGAPAAEALLQRATPGAPGSQIAASGGLPGTASAGVQLPPGQVAPGLQSDGTSMQQQILQRSPWQGNPLGTGVAGRKPATPAGNTPLISPTGQTTGETGSTSMASATPAANVLGTASSSPSRPSLGENGLVVSSGNSDGATPDGAPASASAGAQTIGAPAGLKDGGGEGAVSAVPQATMSGTSASLATRASASSQEVLSARHSAPAPKQAAASGPETAVAPSAGSAGPEATAENPATLQPAQGSTTESENLTLAVPAEESSPETLAAQREQSQMLAQRLSEALGQRLVAQIERGVWQMNIQLHPAHLGKIDVRLSMNGEKSIEAEFTASKEETGELLLSGLPRLKTVMEQSGLNLGRVNVEQQGASPNGGGGQGLRQAAPMPDRRQETAAAPLQSPSPVEPASYIGTHGLDVTV